MKNHNVTNSSTYHASVDGEKDNFEKVRCIADYKIAASGMGGVGHPAASLTVKEQCDSRR